MRELKIEKTFNTPLVNFKGTGQLFLEGKSIPENSLEFYKPLFDWIDGYGQYPAQKTTINVNLEFFNTSTSKCLLTIFKGLEKIKKQGADVSVNWYYSDDDENLLESGQDFAGVLNLGFNFIKVEENFRM
jgi:hypothetical protein